jgi:CDP-glucose 4,6-dehydratase
VAEAQRHWPGSWQDHSDPQAPHEASLLNLVTDKAHHQLRWSPRWDFATTLESTVGWHWQVQEGQA